MISSIKRRGVLLVLVILPNGSRSLIPAAWTDWRDVDVTASLSDDNIDNTSSLGKLGVAAILVNRKSCQRDARSAGDRAPGAPP